MNKEEQKKLLEELEARKLQIQELRGKASSLHEMNIQTGAILGINDAIKIIKKDSK